MLMSSGAIVQTMRNKNLIKKQTDAARIVRGASKLVSLHALYEEVSWDPLETKPKKHRLLLLYKMINNLSQEYLSSLIPLLTTLFLNTICVMHKIFRP